MKTVEEVLKWIDVEINVQENFKQGTSKALKLGSELIQLAMRDLKEFITEDLVYED